MDPNTSPIPSFLRPLLVSQYGEELTDRIYEGYSCRRTVSLRINPLRMGTKQEVLDQLAAAGLTLTPVDWYDYAYLLPGAEEAQVEALPLYEEGKVYLQSLSSMLPPLVLDPHSHDDVLDMAAAPGGKTTQIAALTGNRCRITACERNAIRAERLKYNIAKQGATRVTVQVMDARQLDDRFSFDTVLLDAPCSGSGTLSALSPAAGRFSEELIQKSVRSQRILLQKALHLLKEGQEMVYSTCSILQQENEDVVRSVLGSSVEVVPVDEALMKDLPKLPVTIPGTLCVCPTAEFEGFFVARLRKTGPVAPPPANGSKQGNGKKRKGRR